MPASLPGSTLAQNLANPSLGQAVMFDLLSGPKGSPFDNDGSDTVSTGGLSTGIGFGPNNVMGAVDADFGDDYTVGVTKPDGTASNFSTIMYVGGGRSALVDGTGPDGNGTPPGTLVSVPDVYSAGFGIGAAGNGGSRDAGAGPAFTGFTIKSVTATGAVANGAAIETGFLNRSGVGMVAGQSAFGSATAASATPA